MAYETLSTRRSERGVTYVEFALVFPLLMAFTMATLSVGYLYWLRTSVRASLEDAMRQAEGMPKLWQNVWDTPESQLTDFFTARTELLNSAKSSPLSSGFYSVARLMPVTYYDETKEGERPGRSGYFSYLPPGYCSYVEGWGDVVCNTHVCAPLARGAGLTPPAGFADNQTTPVCEGTGDNKQTMWLSAQDAQAKIAKRLAVAGTCERELLAQKHAQVCTTPRTPGQTLKGLAKNYPTEIVANIEVNTYIFGTRKLRIGVAGFPNLTVPGEVVNQCGYDWDTPCNNWEMPSQQPGTGMCQCDIQCGDATGTQRRNVWCECQRAGQPDRTVEDVLCRASQRPAEVQSCTLPGYPYPGHWIVTPWSGCTAPCGGTGTEYRTVTCSMANGCCDPATRPTTEQGCRWDRVDWTTGGWGPCSVSCGSGVQYRSVTCPSGCCNAQPTNSQGCGLGWGQWQYSYTTPCSLPCNGTSTLAYFCSMPGCCQGADPTYSVPCGTDCGDTTTGGGGGDYVTSEAEMAALVYTAPVTPEYCEWCSYEGATSPLSLDFSSDRRSASLGGDLNLRSFNLDPASKKTVYDWRASGDLPLVVYDPEHKGDIHHAGQLLGHYAFASEADLKSQPGKMRKWVHGFKALESLDANKDAKVSGDELKDLALWFDNNRNAVSEKGEVKSLGEVGVVALYYLANADKDSFSIIAGRGYEVLVDGVTHEGRSVDWFARAAFESYINGSQFSAKIEDAAFFERHMSDGRKLEESIKEHQTTSHDSGVASPISGRWKWEVTGSGDGLPGGVLDIHEDKGVLSGYSEFIGVSGSTVKLPLSGLIDNTKEGALSYKMSVGQDKGLAALSDIKLSKDGGILSGTSTQTYSIYGVDAGSRKVVMMTYSWKASRVK